ncbi:MAG: TetR/AcrR family transcriptional regulator [Spirochaetaceae bacterium]|nr:TetR/AcrR family transcriptional regulator [Spirochaetaceae bacterium]
MTQQAEIKKRSWIFEALMLLLDKKAYGKITMGDIAKKAGVARQTLYLIFKDKDDIVSQFLTESADSRLLSIERESRTAPETGNQDVILITFNTEFVVKHYGVLKKLLTDEYIHNLIIHLTREKVFSDIEYYRAILTPQEYAVCRYKLAYQIAGWFTVLSDWFNAGMPQPLDELIRMLNAIARPAEKSWTHIPNIELRSD